MGNLTQAAYANSAYNAFLEIFAKESMKRNTMSRATWVNPRGVFSSFMFHQRCLATPPGRRGDRKHATLLLSGCV